MMRLLNNKKNVKTVSSIVAFLFVVGVGALAYTQMATPAMASGNSNIGVVDTQQVLPPGSPILTKASEEMNQFQETLRKELEAKEATLDEEGKAQLGQEFQSKMLEKRQQINEGIQKQVSDAAKAVGEAKGLSVVMERGAVLYGGVDITEQVTKKLSEAK